MSQPSNMPISEPAESQIHSALAFQKHILQCERLRAKAILAITFLVLLLILLAATVPGVLPSAYESSSRPVLPRMALVMLGTLVYEGFWLLFLMRLQQAVSPSLSYLNAALECLVPTLLMWLWTSGAGAAGTTGGVLPWLYFPLIIASPLHLNRGLCWTVGLVSAAGFYLAAQWSATVDGAQAEGHILLSRSSLVLKSIMLVASGAVAAFVAQQLRSYLLNALASARELDRAVSIFGQHVSPQVARRLIEQSSELSAELRHVCVLFLDIRGFSTVAAKRSPQEVMDYLNRLFAPMITTVNQHGGIVNKFLGDGFMAIFGAPFEDPELHRNTLRCSHALLACVDTANLDSSLPHTRVGIGIHAGTAMAGTIGSAERKEYTLLGDTVNTAARIEQETKNQNARVIASEALLKGLDDERSKATSLGEVALRGISQPLCLYRIA